MSYESWNFDFDLLTSAIPLMLLIGLMLLSALAHCFFGYYVLRVLLPIYGLVAGFAVGWRLVEYMRPQAGSVELYAGGGVVGVVLMLGAWFLYRLFFSLVLGVLAAGFSAMLFRPLSPISIAIFVVVGLFVALLCYHFAPKLIRVLTAISGAFSTIVILLQLIGWIEKPDEVWQGGVLPSAGIVAVTFILAIMGCYVQFSIPMWIARSRKAKAREKTRLLEFSRPLAGQANSPAHDTRSRKQ